ncbi:MAG: glucokinase [Afipia sp.]|nr:glucokinase [Afipia sp.]
MSDLRARGGKRVLLADIGGTNARFAYLIDGTLSEVTHMAVRNYSSFQDALHVYLSELPDAGAMHSGIFAVSGMIEHDRCALTNNTWIVDAAELRRSCGISTVRLVNDFEAVAWSLPRLSRGMLLQIGGHEPDTTAPVAVLGPGTGLGMAISAPHANGRLLLPSEGGHCSLAGDSAREETVINCLRQKYGHVSAERVLSGEGIENLYDILAVLDGISLPKRSAAEITQSALEGTCSISRAALDMFCAFLGSVAGNLALTLCAKGGVYIGGGIMCRIPEFVANSQFRERFEGKGRFRKYLEAIPVHLILKADVAFLGMCELAEAEGIA